MDRTKAVAAVDWNFRQQQSLLEGLVQVDRQTD